MDKASQKTQQLKNSDKALWRQIKAAAALAGVTMTEWIETIAKEKLDQKPE